MQECTFFFNNDFSGNFSANAEYKGSPLSELPLLAEIFNNIAAEKAVKKFSDTNKAYGVTREALVKDYVKNKSIDDAYKNRSLIFGV